MIICRPLRLRDSDIGGGRQTENLRWAWLDFAFFFFLFFFFSFFPCNFEAPLLGLTPDHCFEKLTLARSKAFDLPISYLPTLVAGKVATVPASVLALVEAHGIAGALGEARLEHLASSGWRWCSGGRFWTEPTGWRAAQAPRLQGSRSRSNGVPSGRVARPDLQPKLQVWLAAKQRWSPVFTAPSPPCSALSARLPRAALPGRQGASSGVWRSQWLIRRRQPLSLGKARRLDQPGTAC